MLAPPHTSLAPSIQRRGDGGSSRKSCDPLTLPAMDNTCISARTARVTINSSTHTSSLIPHSSRTGHPERHFGRFLTIKPNTPLLRSQTRSPSHLHRWLPSHAQSDQDIPRIPPCPRIFRRMVPQISTETPLRNTSRGQRLRNQDRELPPQGTRLVFF